MNEDLKFILTGMNNRIDRVETKIDKLLRFKWQIIGGSLIGSSLIGTFISLLAIYYKK